MVLGVIGLLFFPIGLIALIVGIVALGQTGSPGNKGRGFAIAGTAMGGASLVIGPIIVLLIAILLPALGAARNTAQRMQNSTQLRGIHQGLVTYANSNKNNFPGLAADGQIWANGANTGNSGDGNTPQAMMWIMMDGDYFTPEYAISPSETGNIYEYLGTGPVTQDNYSYAKLSFLKTGGINTDPVSGDQTYAIDPTTAGRASEWKQTLNSQAIVMSDRNTGSNPTTGVDSIHSGTPGMWRGSILWNDNHVAFESTHLFQTKYGKGGLLNNDNLFEDGNTGGYDALMVHDKP